jgi:hypothetical protein
MSEARSELKVCNCDSEKNPLQIGFPKKLPPVHRGRVLSIELPLVR